MSYTTTSSSSDTGGFLAPPDLDGDGDGDLDGGVGEDPDEDRYADLDSDDPEREPNSTVALFEGDEGGLELPQRRALVALLKQRFLSGRTHPKEWRALLANPQPIRARLNDLFLELQIDTEREVAYKRQVPTSTGGRPFPTMLHDTPWGREDTILLVYLRSRLRAEQASGAGRVFVDRADMAECVSGYRPGHATNVSGDEKRTEKAIDTLYKAGLLIGPRGGDRFEVSAAIEVLLPLPTLTELLTWLRDQNTTPTATDTAVVTDPPDNADDNADGVGGGTTSPEPSADDEDGAPA